ncbi:MAG: M23 family metallopeptidase [Chlorobium sp.]|nr:M23 family metallopeptidase [Chlorobium sp.]
MSAKRNKSTVYTLSLVSDGGRRRSVKLLQGRPVTFLLVLGAVAALLAGLTGLIVFGSPLGDMIPGWSLSVNQKKLVALQAARVDSLIIEIKKMSSFSQKVEGVMFQEKELAIQQGGDGGGSGQSIFYTGLSPVHASPGTVNPPGFTGRLVTGSVSQRFKPKESHYGVDIATPLNEPVGAVADGAVIFADWTGRFGYSVIIDHGEYMTFYKHCSRLFKKGGEQVKLGEIIALAGNRGRESSGTHLHFEVWRNGIPVDPEAYLNFTK